MRINYRFLVLLLCVGCQAAPRVTPPPGCEPVFNQYHLKQFDWSAVSRVLILPFSNESSHNQADEQINRALRAELQQLGRFEVVAAPPDDIARLSEQIHQGGRYSEEAMLQLGRAFNADVVIHGTITHYSPYPRPRIGVTIQAVSPSEGKVISSVDGLWDANHVPIAKRAQSYYVQRHMPRTDYHDANLIYQDDGHADELALLSPQLYQRWVCSEVAAILVQNPAKTGVIFSPRGTRAQTPTKPMPETRSPVEIVPVGTEFPLPQRLIDPRGIESDEPDLAPKSKQR